MTRATVTISDEGITSTTTADHDGIDDMIDIVTGVLNAIGYSNQTIAVGFKDWMQEHEWEIK